jgi:hypothetical protein
LAIAVGVKVPHIAIHEYRDIRRLENRWDSYEALAYGLPLRLSLGQ